MFLPYLASIFTGLLYGVTESINKNITEDRYSPFSYGFIQYLLNAIIFLIPALFYFHLPAWNIAYLYLTISVVLTLGANSLTIKAYKTEDISNMSILSSVTLLTTVIMGMLFLSEPMNAYKIAGITMIILGIIVIFYEGKRLVVSKGLFIALVAKIMWGMQPLFDKKALLEFNMITYSFLTMTVLSLLHIMWPRVRKEARQILGKYTREIILSRITVTTGVFLYFWGLQRGNISIFNTNVDTVFLLSTVVIGIIVLGERKNIVKKLTGSFLCILGIFLLNFF